MDFGIRDLRLRSFIISISDLALAPRGLTSRYTLPSQEGRIRSWTDKHKIDFILDHYENPRHYGPLADASVVQKGGNPGCGDVVTFYLEGGGDGRIEDISFEGEGCTISQAACSIVTEMFTGKTLAEWRLPRPTSSWTFWVARSPARGSSARRWG